MENPILHRGTLTLSKLKELASEHLTVKDSSDVYNPEKNHKTISITEQEDGNWKGKAYRHGKIVEIRAGDPNTVLVMLLTHS